MEQIDPYEVAPSTVGALFDDVPRLTTALVRPHVIAGLIHRGAIRYSEILASITPYCSVEDLKVGNWDPLEGDYCDDCTRLERLLDEVLGEFVGAGLVRYNEEKELWVLTAKDIPKVISWVSVLGGRMPDHFLLYLSQQQTLRYKQNDQA
jgi:hypothetical protein